MKERDSMRHAWSSRQRKSGWLKGLWLTYEFALFDHGGQDQLGTADALIEGSSMELLLLALMAHCGTLQCASV